MYTLLFVFVAFILGLYMCLNYKSNDFKEGFVQDSPYDIISFLIVLLREV